MNHFSEHSETRNGQAHSNEVTVVRQYFFKRDIFQWLGSPSLEVGRYLGQIIVSWGVYIPDKDDVYIFPHYVPAVVLSTQVSDFGWGGSMFSVSP